MIPNNLLKNIQPHVFPWTLACFMHTAVQIGDKLSMFCQVTGPWSHIFFYYHITSSSQPSIVPVSISNSVSFLFLVSWQLVWNRKKLHILKLQLWGTSRSINIVLCLDLKLIKYSHDGILERAQQKDEEQAWMRDYDNHADNKLGNNGIKNLSDYKMISHIDDIGSCNHDNKSYTIKGLQKYFSQLILGPFQNWANPNKVKLCLFKLTVKFWNTAIAFLVSNSSTCPSCHTRNNKVKISVRFWKMINFKSPQKILRRFYSIVYYS